MSLFETKVALTMAGVSGVGLGGYGIYHLASSGESIGERITNSLKGTNKRFVGKEDSEWSNLQEKYTSTFNKPKSKGSSADLPFSDLPDWCDRNYRERYSISKEELSKQVSNFCFFNTNTVLEELKGHSLISGDRAGSEWQTAWDSYNSGKSSKNLVISGSTDDAKLNGSNKAEAAPILHDWCTASSQKKMYSSNIDVLLPRFKAWCISK
ncbi:hypothetical protein MHF_0718 [Mycoplasma haemofelis Ohio2]|uniref:Uncharacterized protein n=1 Tax=Mycoplasma haemofelis (strain Ohio2) TaxID=859194 RepID=F6FIE0_MYCHI|nr:hypothetical protein MHF_0718 [Mycoplasma haemofelis Ohio2]